MLRIGETGAPRSERLVATPSVDGSAVPQAFLSYAHTDDKGLDGAISWLKNELETTVHLLTGRPFTIFQDRNDIEFGQNWSICLDEALEQARFLIPVLTPSYFMSVHCRDEAEKFIKLEAKSGRHDLILPIYLIEAEVLEHPMMRAADSLAKHLHKRQRSDWRDPEMQWRTNPKIKQKIIKLAQQIDKAMKRTAAPAERSHLMAPVKSGEGLDASQPAPVIEPIKPSLTSEPPYVGSDAFVKHPPSQNRFPFGPGSRHGDRRRGKPQHMVLGVETGGRKPAINRTFFSCR
ncbi:MAG: toll/interleukin-1 receptor domain-containing protein [Pseudomonadota bacterium]